MHGEEGDEAGRDRKLGKGMGQRGGQETEGARERVLGAGCYPPRREAGPRDTLRWKEGITKCSTPTWGSKRRGHKRMCRKCKGGTREGI